MTEVVQQLESPPLPPGPRPTDGHEPPARRPGRDPDSDLDTSVSFPELVWAHFKRQEELKADVRDGEWETEYRRRLKRFQDKHGELAEAYWCRFEASGVALTEKLLPRRIRKLWRRDSILRLHTATDWRTAKAPTVASWLHQWETAGIKASEVLRDTSERIALLWIYAASSRLLGTVDREPGKNITDAELEPVAKEHEAELKEVQDYYLRAGENSARIVYFRGMAWGTLVLAAFVGGAFLLSWGLDWIDPADESTYTLFVCLVMGAVGAILSVMTRMARKDGFSLEFEVGRKSVRYLGALRPWIGAMFALVVYLALKAGLVSVLEGNDDTTYFFATIAFFAGFSERRAKVLLTGAIGGTSTSSDGSAEKA